MKTCATVNQTGVALENGLEIAGLSLMGDANDIYITIVETSQTTTFTPTMIVSRLVPQRMLVTRNLLHISHQYLSDMTLDGALRNLRNESCIKAI